MSKIHNSFKSVMSAYAIYLSGGGTDEFDDELIIKYADAFNNSYQDNLYDYIKCIVENHRYSSEYSFPNPVIDHLISKGASMSLLTPHLMQSDRSYDDEFEDETGCIEVRMALLDSYWDKLDHEYIITHTRGWETIVPIYWEDIPEDAEPMTKWNTYIKYCSKMLNGGTYADGSYRHLTVY
jgi:hypothetical protein